MNAIDFPIDLETGIAEIDNHHRAFVALTNRILTAAPAEMPSADQALAALRRYADHHFSAEEAQMRIHGFAGMRQHVMHHERFRRELFEIVQLSLAPGSVPQVRARLRILVQDWFLDHIRTMDLALATFLNDVSAARHARLAAASASRKSGDHAQVEVLTTGDLMSQIEQRMRTKLR